MRCTFLGPIEPPGGDRRLLLITVDNRIVTAGESNRQIEPMEVKITV